MKALRFLPVLFLFIINACSSPEKEALPQPAKDVSKSSELSSPCGLNPSQQTLVAYALNDYMECENGGFCPISETAVKTPSLLLDQNTWWPQSSIGNISVADQEGYLEVARDYALQNLYTAGCPGMSEVCIQYNFYYVVESGTEWYLYVEVIYTCL